MAIVRGGNQANFGIVHERSLNIQIGGSVYDASIVFKNTFEGLLRLGVEIKEQKSL